MLLRLVPVWTLGDEVELTVEGDTALFKGEGNCLKSHGLESRRRP